MPATVAVLTPTYNRAYILDQLYQSLRKQNCYDFVWYIIDDGSTDQTDEQVAGYQTDLFQIVYQKKENGGKHTALNAGIDLISEALTFIVDSDDYLTEDAIEIIRNDWCLYQSDPEIGGLSYYRVYGDRTVIGDTYKTDRCIDTYLSVRVNQHLLGDKAEVYRTDILKTHKFPVFEQERFLSEAVVWAAISRAGYQLVFIDKGIYVGEYRSDGLTSAGRKYRLENPLGTMEHAKAFICKEVKFKIRVKYMLLYIAATYFSNRSWRQAKKDLSGYSGLFSFCFLPGNMLAFYWKRKYRL